MMVGYIVRHSHLGLGKITEFKTTTVRVKFFEGMGVEREFSHGAVREGALARTQLSIGNRCIGPNGECAVIRVITPKKGPYDYQVVYPDGYNPTVSETALTPIKSTPVQDPLRKLAGLDPQEYALFQAREELIKAVNKTYREVNGLTALLSSRIDLRPHQAYISGVVILDRCRRYILADEVGLGKTIEAGIVIHDLIWRKPNARILVVCPGALTQQWLCELYAKFGGQVFTLLDLHVPELVNWKAVQKAIVSTSLAAYSLSPILVEIQWDMVVVDESHHLLTSTILYDFVKRLSLKVPSLLLLSAIPAQRREDEFLRLLALLDPKKYQLSNAKAIEEFRELYNAQEAIGRLLRRISNRINGIKSGEVPIDEVEQLLKKLLELPILERDVQLRGDIDSLCKTAPTYVGELESLIHDVGDRYRINRRILRNRRKRLIEKEELVPIERKYMPFPYQPEQLEIETYEAIQTIITNAKEKGLKNDLLLPFARVLFQSLVTPACVSAFLTSLMKAKSAKINSKGYELLSMDYATGYTDWDIYSELLCVAVLPYVQKILIKEALDRAHIWKTSGRGLARRNLLVKVLLDKKKKDNQTKLIVFAGFPGVALELGQDLSKQFGEEAVTDFRNDLPPEQKEKNVIRFQSKSSTWILVTDETGGEGRNFQFASEILHFDTPWYPGRIEQRIGRLDRIGREKYRKDVVSNVFYNESSIEAGLVECYDAGLNIFKESISGLEFALRSVERLLAEKSLCNEGREDLFKYSHSLRELASKERAHDASEAVMDEASFDRKNAGKFRRISAEGDTEGGLERAFVNYFQKISSYGSAKGLHDDTFPRGIWKFLPADARYGDLPNLGGLTGEYRGTFRREIAQQRPSLNFFNVGNPLYDSVIQSLGIHSTGRTYAVDCVTAERKSWLGFEFIFRAKPDLSTLEEIPGLVNQVHQKFLVYKPINLFYREDGFYEENGQELLAIRRSLNKDNENKVWWNIVNDKAILLSDIFGSSDWQGVLYKLFKMSIENAYKIFKKQVGNDIQAEILRIDELIRTLGKDVTKLEEHEIIAYKLMKDSLDNWMPELDCVGFLSINGNILGK